VVALLVFVIVVVPFPVHAAQASQAKPDNAATFTLGRTQAGGVVRSSRPQAASGMQGYLMPQAPCVVARPGASAAPTVCDPIACIFLTVHIKSTGTNTFSVYGNATNNCGATLHLAEVYVTATQYCPVDVKLNWSGVSVPLPDPWYAGSVTGYIAAGWGYCEVCYNHVPSVFPPFQETAFVAADGVATGGQQYINSVRPSASVQLANSPSWAVTCP
jgi:hypothetical protein